MMTLRRALALVAAASFAVLFGCGGNDSGGGGGDSGGGNPDGGNPGNPGGGSSTRTSTAAERDALCSLIPEKHCEAYQGSKGNCLADHGHAAECFVTAMTNCVSKLPTCQPSDYDGCMTEGIRACDPNTPAYVQQCLDKNRSCGKSQSVEDACTLLAALDDEGRKQGADCVAGSCDSLDECLNNITP